jgi:hypothetical protein
MGTGFPAAAAGTPIFAAMNDCLMLSTARPPLPLFRLQGSGRTGKSAVTSAPATAAWASTASILAVAVTPVASTTTGS